MPAVNVLCLSLFLALSGQVSITAPAQKNTAKLAVAPSNDAFNQRFVRLLHKHIAGREDLPAREVFRNVELLGDMSAGKFIELMDRGFARSLNVRCTYCHVANDFSSDVRRPKRAAREMIALQAKITEQLQHMESLETTYEKRSVRCATCHVNALKPGGRL